ncbi:hypothetical protein GGS24DRAFT_458333 [Hypoxylon argillaceum]|nr:hypothetical protein GGS24DRAFT_458333 [Hypoxylon argillaceum]
MPCQPITLVSMTYGVDGQPHQNVISGPKLAFSCLPEEGLYIIYKDRGVQIASVCRRRKCCITQVCRCMEQQQHIDADVTTVAANAGTKQQNAQDLSRRFGLYFSLAWFRFYEVETKIRALRLCFLAHPRTLSWDNVFGNAAFHFDSELEEHYASIHSYRFPTTMPQITAKGLTDCSRRLINSIGHAWREFLECEYYNSKPVAAYSDLVWEKDKIEDFGNGADDGDLDISEWDDADAPILTTPVQGQPSIILPDHQKKRPKFETDFDLIDDLIEEEFPRLKNTLR